MEIVEVTTKDQLDKLYKGSALTFEGVILSEASQYRDFFKNLTNVDESKPCYHIKGKVMKVLKIKGNPYTDYLDIDVYLTKGYESFFNSLR